MPFNQLPWMLTSYITMAHLSKLRIVSYDFEAKKTITIRGDFISPQLPKQVDGRMSIIIQEFYQFHILITKIPIIETFLNIIFKVLST